MMANLERTRALPTAASGRRRADGGAARERLATLPLPLLLAAVCLAGADFWRAPAAASSHLPKPSSENEELPRQQLAGQIGFGGGAPRNGRAAPLAQLLAAAPDAPKLVPLSALERYMEGAELRLFCSAAASPSGGRPQFEWRKNRHELLGRPPTATPAGAATGSAARAQVTMVDEFASVLRIARLEADDGGNYTCLVRNQQGADSSTVRVNVNVRLKWLAEPPAELQVRAGKPLQLECDAAGQPAPLISWTSFKEHRTIASKVLRIDRVSANDSGLYECRASTSAAAAGPDSTSGPGEQLRKLVRLIVNGK